MARAIWGRARATAEATVASSALIRRAISSDDLRSRSLAAWLGCSVRSWGRVELGFKLEPFGIGGGGIILNAGGRGEYLMCLRYTLSPLRGLLVARPLTQGLRPGVHSTAASRLS